MGKKQSDDEQRKRDHADLGLAVSIDAFRIYEPHECGMDGYPVVWHRVRPGERRGVKDLVREAAEDRCERCKHPYVLGSGEWGNAEPTYDDVMHPQGTLAVVEVFVEQGTPISKTLPTLWSACDERCCHGGPVRARVTSDPWVLNRTATCGDVQRSVRDRNQVQASWRILTVHHLNGHKHDLRWWNLAALCQRCHLEIQSKVLMSRVYPFEHSEWFKPHAAGWYAYAYEGREVTREEALERQDELLALERMA